MARYLLVSLLVALALPGCSRPVTWELNGETMGTTFNVQLVDAPETLNLAELREEINDTLATVNGIASTYETTSELSQFNASASEDWVMVSSMLCGLVERALAISRETDGAFDVSLGGLVRLWGFGPDFGDGSIPDGSEIDALLERSGFTQLEADCTKPALRKRNAGLEIDLSASAKGSAVDAVAEDLLEVGVQNFLVEIGGEIRVRGKNERGTPFAIAVEAPEAASRSVLRVVELDNAAIATSGDYRNFVEIDGKRYSHAINPATGYPIEHALASVSVVARTTERADALATALLVMGPERGPEFAEQSGIAALFQVRESGSISVRTTTAFDEVTQ